VVHWMRHRHVYVVPSDRSIQILHGEAGYRRFWSNWGADASKGMMGFAYKVLMLRAWQ
jgi:hypothetical protein